MAVEVRCKNVNLEEIMGKSFDSVLYVYIKLCNDHLSTCSRFTVAFIICISQVARNRKVWDNRKMPDCVFSGAVLRICVICTLYRQRVCSNHTLRQVLFLTLALRLSAPSVSGASAAFSNARADEATFVAFLGGALES